MFHMSTSAEVQLKTKLLNEIWIDFTVTTREIGYREKFNSDAIHVMVNYSKAEHSLKECISCAAFRVEGVLC